MAVTLVNPAGLPQTDLYKQVSVATGSKMVFIAGQVARDADGNRIGEGDLATQTEQCYLNIATALTEVGASWGDIAKLTAYIVDWTPEKMAQLVEGGGRAAAKLGIEGPLAPLTGIGVSALAEPDLLVEIEATAVLD
ncbi:RidA family protein [Rhodococcus sp. HNM0563]|uniref:RidA family protein n=1 Tax=Rhodococcus sp. HNM0563 TaxID=2716339 RepID=UPI00146B7ACD|nr:RidA family protein [Rhodococcus sp. HNM0563]NLU63869.1 RidA family protein [Rhodococcus sp. HNM0563]